MAPHVFERQRSTRSRLPADEYQTRRAHIDGPFMLPMTIAENIAYGRPNVTQAAIQQAARLAGAGEFIDCLPQGYRTRLSDGDANLSGGQRQRIALARALLTEASILVLDEPTSALDAYHEQLVADTLRSLKGKRTVVLVSHRINTVADCDLICVLHMGTIVEQGSHNELMQRGGYYAAMAKQQRDAETGLEHGVCNAVSTGESSRLFMDSHLSTKMV